MSSVSVIIAAAGSASRMNGIPKQLYRLCGKPVIAYSLEVFQKMEQVSEIIISARSEHMDMIKGIVSEYNITKVKAVAEGGETRQQSVVNALKYVSRETGLIAVHDAARPLVREKYIAQCIRDAEIFGGAALGVPVKDTIKEVEGGLVTDTPDRRRLYITQTPQIFKKQKYFEGVNFAAENGLDFTDDCQLAEAVGVKICMTPSDYFNIKLTTPEDIAVAEALINIISE